VPKNSLSFGCAYLVKKIIERLGIAKILKGVFPERYEKYLYLAMYKIITGEAYYLYTYWKEDAYLPEGAAMDSKRISDLLQELGEDESSIEQFFAKWISMNKSLRAVVFDITSISSYSEGNELLEYGYNRDGEDLEQVNLGVISKELEGSLHLPLAYRIYPGSIRDVTTLHNVLELVEKYEMVLSTCVMDKGFFSQQNIQDLHQKKLKYLISVPFSADLAKDAVNSSYQELSSPLNAFSFRKAVYFHCAKSISYQDSRCTLHIYLDKEKKAREENKLLSLISDIEAAFQRKSFKNKSQAEHFVAETLKSKKKFFKIKKLNGRFVVSRNQPVIEAQIKLFGAFVILTNQQINKVSALELYRDKDGTEKIFRSFKNDICEKRSRTKSTAAMRGSFFISFLAVIILAHVTQTMRRHDLFKQFSKQEIFKCLTKLKVFTLANNQNLLAEASKKQKNIFSAFGLKKLDPSYNLAGF
jgi:transposase